MITILMTGRACRRAFIGQVDAVLLLMVVMAQGFQPALRGSSFIGHPVGTIENMRMDSRRSQRWSVHRRQQRSPVLLAHSGDFAPRRDEEYQASPFQRRAFIAGVVLTSQTIPAAAAAQSAPGVPTRRTAGVGGGIDVRFAPPPAAADAIYPASMLGLWQCQRVVTQVEGDAGQAEVAWKALGGTGEDAFTKREIEKFATKFIAAPPGIPNTYTFEGETLGGVVLDRSFEVKERTKTSSTPVWNAERPDVLLYKRRQEEEAGTELAVVTRSIELPSERGFGSNEFVRITTAEKPPFGLGDVARVERAVRVQRRFRRAFDKDGGRIVEGLEIVKTYRVLDGIAGAEMPTSTTKSQIRLSELSRR